MWWNFVGRSHEEIVAWRAAYQAEMGFEAPEPGSPLVGSGVSPARPDGVAALGAPVSGERLARLLDHAYDDGRPFPQFGDFPPGQPAPIPAPPLPTTRMKPRANPPSR